MRRQSGLVLMRVKTLDERDLIWRLPSQVVPPVRRVVANAERGALPIRVDIQRRDEVPLWIERATVCDSEWAVRSGFPIGCHTLMMRTRPLSR